MDFYEMVDQVVQDNDQDGDPLPHRGLKVQHALRRARAATSAASEPRLPAGDAGRPHERFPGWRSGEGGATMAL
jgi:hypothetical protein